jgi:hypothetical protein
VAAEVDFGDIGTAKSNKLWEDVDARVDDGAPAEDKMLDGYRA